MCVATNRNPATGRILLTAKSQSESSTKHLRVESKRRKRLAEASTCRNVSSWKVFMSCVTHRLNGTVDVSTIFSREGFDKWLKTRGHKIQHPQQSYQRVLYAHIRGADKRKPFPEDVEQALLRLLRDTSNKNPWKQLFANDEHKVGRRGFKQKGFHEKSSSSNDDESSGNNDYELEMNEASIAVVDDDFEIPLTSLENSSKENQETSSDGSFSDEKDEESLLKAQVRFKLMDHIRDGSTPYDMIMKSFETWMPYEQRNAVATRAAERGIPLQSPALLFFLSMHPEPGDMRFDLEFLVPTSQRAMQFKKDKLVAKLKVGNDWVVTDEDENALKLFQESSINKHLYQITSKNLICGLYAKIRSLPLFFSKGVVWRRCLMQRDDGTQAVFLFKAENCGSHQIVSFQDISDDFPNIPEVLSLPTFL